MKKWTERRFLSFDKTPIFYRRLKPASEVKATILVVHGMGEHGGRYQAMAEFLAERGFQLLIPDLRGFGKSGGKRACLRSFSQYFEDLAALHRLITEEEKGTPVFLLGHSLGGLIASAYAAFFEHPPMKGLILSSPCFGIAIQVPLGKHLLGILNSFIMPDLAQNSGLNPKHLTHDKEIVERYINDPLVCRVVSARLYHEMIRMLGRKEEIAARLRCPLLILQAGMDIIVSKQATLLFYEKLKITPKAIEIYENSYHEVLNETNRMAVWERLGQWAEQMS